MPGHGSSIIGSPASSCVRIEDKFASKGGFRTWFGRAAILIAVAVAAFLGTMALGYLPQLGSLVDTAVRSHQSTAIPAVSPAFFGIAGLVGFLVLIALVRSVDTLLRRFRTSPLPATESVRQSELILEEAAPQRAEPPSESPSAALDPATEPPRTSASESRNSNSAQRKAIHAAALMAIESRSLRSPEASRPRRRGSDYDGPRRRATDNRPDVPAFKGPYRRTEDHHGTLPAKPNQTELSQHNPPLMPPPNERLTESRSKNRHPLH